MIRGIYEPGRRKLTAFFTSIGVYFLLMSLVIITHRLDTLSLESFAVSLAAGIMAISYGYYASNAYVAQRRGPTSEVQRPTERQVRDYENRSIER